MTRKAVIIGAPGKGYNFLKGVRPDIINIKSHLKSIKGGAWNEGEIIFLNDPSINEINRKCNSIKADYVFVYFSGHGSTNQFGQRIAHLSNGDKFEDKELLNYFNTQRLTIIMDMCRTFMPDSIGGFTPLEEDAWSQFDGTALQRMESRRIFDGWINKSKPGKIIIHATNHLNAAKDLGTGGLFTMTLLNLASHVKAKDNRASLRSVDSLAKEAAIAIQKGGHSQRPQITYNEGELLIPFAIGLPEMKLSTMKVQPKPSGASTTSVILNTAAVLGLIWALSADE